MERKCRLTVIGIWICLVLPLIVSEAKAQIRISKSSLTIEEGGKGSYKLHLDAPPSSEITLDITTTNSDVRVKPKSLTFTLGDWGKARKITVEAIRDADAEDDRAIISHSVRTASNSRRGSANLQAATAIAPSSLTVIVLDRYVPSHEVNISPSSGLSIRKGGSGNYSVSLIEKPDASVTVWASSDRSDVRVSPSSLKFYVGTWSSTRSFTVSVDADAASSSATISHSATSEDINYQGLTIDSLPVTVLQPPAGITQPPSRTKVLVGQTKTYYSPGLRSQPTDTVTINASSQAAGNATVTGSKSFGTGNWSTAQDFKVTGQSPGTATITYDVDSSDSRYDGYRLSSTSVTVEATTITCRADDVNIQLGGSSTLSWDSTNANSVTIDQGVGSVPVDSPDEGKTVTPPQPGAAETSKTTTYRFTAAGGGDPGACSVTITVWRPPSVDGFSADPTTLRKQQTTRLSWATSHASSTTIDQGVGSVPVDSSEEVRSVSPPQPSTAETSRSTSYTLTASNPGFAGADAASAAVSVTVWNRPSVDSLTASPSTIDEGEDSGLKWTTTHATGVSIDQGVGPVAVDDETGTTKVSPHQDTTYTLAASNPAYSGTHAVTDTVRITVLPATVLQPPAGITQPPSRTKVLVGQTKTYYSPGLRSQPTDTVTINASSQAAGNATVTSSKSFGTGNWSTAQDFKVTGQSPGTATITYDVDSSDSRYDGYRLNSTSVTVEATTITCGADDINIQLGGSSTLSWDSTNANSVTIDQGVGSVPVDSPDEGKTVTPPQPGAAETSKTTTYRFTAAGGGDPGACSVTITVWRPPSVDGFSADPTTLRKQQTTRLSWATGHASSTTIDQGVGSVPIDSSGQGRSVSPPQPSTAETSRSTSYTLTASNPGYTGADAASATVSVTVWNRPTVDSFTASPSTIDEGEDSGLKWTTTHATGVSIDQGVGPVSVDDETGTTKVSPHQDTTYTLAASNPAYSGTRAVTDTVRVTVRRPTSSPGLSVSPTTLNITEGAAGKTYNVRLRTQPSRDVTVTVEVESGGDSRVQKNTSSLTFTTADWNRNQAVQVFAEEKSGTATGQARIANTPPSSYGGSAVDVTVNVADDDEPPPLPRITLSSDEAGVSEPDGTAMVTAAVAIGEEPAGDLTINLTHSGQATNGTDYTVATLTIGSGETSGNAELSVIDDKFAEGTEEIRLIANADGYRDSTPLSMNLTDDDSAGVTVTPTSLTIPEGGGLAYRVMLTSRPSHDVTVTITRSGNGDIGIDDQELTFTDSDWNQAQTVAVTAAQDDDARDDTATLSHTVSSTDGDYNGISVSEVEVTVTDDEIAGLSIRPTELTIAEGGSETYQVVLTSQPAHDVTVTITRSGDGDIGIDDQELTFTDSDWKTARVVRVSAAQDNDARDDAATFSHTVSSTDADYNGIGVSEVEVAVTDDETAGVSITPTKLTIAEGASDSYQVVLTSQPAHDVIIAVTHSGDQDIGIDDQELTFTDSDWNQAQTVAVTAAQDDDARDDAATFSHTVSSTDGDYNGIGVSEVEVAVTDDETAGVSITPTELTIAEGGSDSYQVVLTSQPAHDVTITITHGGDPDIGIANRELTFTDSDWEMAQTVTVAAAQDEDARDDTATLGHSVASTDGDYNGISVSQVAVTATDDETASVSITPTQLTIAEGGSDTYQVFLTSQPAQGVTITITHSGDADIDSDLDRLTFSSSDWKQEKTVTVRAAQDDDARDDTATLSHTVSSTDGDYNGIGVSQVDVTATDDETAGVSITPTQLTIAEGGSDSYRVVLTSKPSHEVTVTINHGGDADIDSAPDRLTFSPSNWNQEKTVTVTSAQDGDARDDTATLSHTVSSTDGDYNGVTVSAVDVAVRDDETPGVSIRPEELTIAEGGSDSYEVVLTSKPSHDVTVTISYTGDQDVSIDDQELTFTGSDWETAQTVTVSAAQDDDARDDTAALSHAVASTDEDYNGIAVPEVVVAVTDDETAGVFITPTELTIAEGGSDTYQVVLTSQPAHDVTVTISYTGDQDVSIDDQELTFTGSDWETPQTVTVSAAQDDDARDDTATLSHSVASTDGDYNGIGVSEVEVAVTDNETAGASIRPEELTIVEGASDSYEVVLTSQPSHEVIVTITHSGDGDIGMDHQELTFTGSDWETAQTVTVSAAQDDDARDDTATLSHSVASTDGDYNGIGVSEVEVTATDDETAGVSILPEELTIAEGGSDSYRVVLTSKPSHEVTVTITHGGDNDIDSDPDRLTFSPSNWNQEKTVTVTSAQDDDARDDAATLSHSVASTDTDYNGIGVSEVDVAVTDDETAGVSILPEELTIAEGGSDSYQVFLMSQPAHDVTVTISYSGDQDVSIDDQELTFTGSDWETPQTVTVSADQDEDARDDTATLSHTVSSTDGDYNGITVSEVEVTVTDDETAGVTVTPASLTIPEGGGLAYRVKLTSRPAHDVIIAVTHSGDPDIGIDNRELTFTDSDWETAQTVAVTAAQDDDARDDTATLSHTVSSTDGDYNGIGVSEVEVAVTDDEIAGLSIRPTELTIAEGGSETYQVVLTSQPAHDVTVTITRSGDGDIGIDDQELTFTDSDWETAQTVTVSAAQDDDARDDVATLSHSVASTDTDYNGISVSQVAVTATDDETAGVSITPTKLTIAEGGSNAYQVVLTSQPTDDVTVTITHSGDGDIGMDHQELTFTDSDWEAAQTVAVAAAQDGDARDDTATLSHTVSSTDGDYNGVTVSAVDVTVRDDETPGVSIRPEELTIAEGGSDSYEVVLTSQPAHDVTVTITHGGDAEIDSAPDRLTFSSSDWSQEKTVTVRAAQDGDARDDTATLSHTVSSTDGDYNGITVSEVEVTVTDDEIAGLSIRPTELTIAEGGSETYQVVLTSQPSHDVTVTITRSGDGDIGIDDQELTFTDSDWETAQTVTVSAAQDDDARDDVATLSHSVASTDTDYNGISVSQVAVTATDDETAGVSIRPEELTIAEGASDSYEVVLTSQPSHDVTVTITHSGDGDISIGDQELTFTDSDWETAQTVTVSAAQDDDARHDAASLSHTVSSADTDYNGIAVPEVAVTVTDDETAGVSIRPEELTIAEGASDSYEVVLTSQPSHDVTVTITHSGDGDISIGDQELTFTDSDWETAQTVTVSAAQDDDARHDAASLSHTVSSADTDYNGIAVPEVAVTVTDDETAGVKVAPTRLAIPEDASTTYTVALTSRPSRPVVVALSHSGDPDISANVAQVSFEPSEWDNPSTVTVQASRDPDAVDDTATLRHSASSSDSTYDGAPVDPVRITVGDLDSVGVNITPLNLTIDEGASRTYTVVLTSKPSQDVVVEVDRSGDEDLVSQPDSLTFTGSNWQDPQAVTVQALQDPDAVDDTATLLHSTTSSDAAYGGLTVPGVSVSVIDDDTTGVNVSPLELAVLEGTSETCTVALASKPSAEVHISLNSNNNDVSPSPAFLTFSPTTWSTAQEVMVPVAQDEDATDEVATLTFSATSPDPAYHGISVSAVSVDINDDDNAGVKVVPNPHMSVPEGESATYTIVLLSQPLATVAVAISSSNPQMLTAAFDEVTFTQDNWSVAQTVAFDTFHDDNTLDENEVLSHSAVSLDPNYKGISVTPLLVTITDRTAEKLTRTLPVLLSAMSGALAESIQTAVESRFERRRQMQRMKQDQGWWMPSYYQDRSRLSPEFNPSGGPETEPILSRASFGLPLAGNAFGGTHWRPVLWGHGDFQHFSGTSSLVDFRGRLSATHVGMDLLSNRHVLTGLSFARSWGAMGYSDDREGQLAASFNTFHPYLYWQPHRRLSLWGIGGMGRGSVDLRDPRLAHVFNSEFRMWAGGLRSVLTKPGKNELGFRLDGFMSNIAIDPVEQIREVFGRASRARAMLEAVHQRGGRKRSFSLKGEIGGRLDRGEAVHGAAMEAGLRLGFIDTPTGLDLSLQGRMLLFHDGGYRDWGAGLQASWDPGNKRRGLRMSAASSHGQNGRAGATLWDDSNAYAFGQGRSLPGNPVPVNRIDSEAAYSMEVLQGRGLLTPFSRLRWTGHGKEFSVGSEFGLQPRSPDTNPLNLELQGIRGKSSRGPNMGVRIRMSIPF